MKFRKVTEMITIDKDNSGWYILDPHNLSGHRTVDGNPIIKFGPYSSDIEAQEKREILYHIIYGDYS
jgi:streptomycin 6-kinase